jgi:hypothetical protein
LQRSTARPSRLEKYRHPLQIGAFFRCKINSHGRPGGCLENEEKQAVVDRWDRAAFKSVPMFFNVFVPPPGPGFFKLA